MSDIPAGWQPDPRGRHEYRYWDGTQWTDHVSNQGEVSQDPVADASSAASAATSEPATTQAPATEVQPAGEREPEPVSPHEPVTSHDAGAVAASHDHEPAASREPEPVTAEPLTPGPEPTTTPTTGSGDRSSFAPPGGTAPATHQTDAKAAAQQIMSSKSPELATILSVIAPGSGHFYLGKSNAVPVGAALLVATLAGIVISHFSFLLFLVGLAIIVAAAAFAVIDLRGGVQAVQDVSLPTNIVGILLIAAGVLMLVALFLPFYRVDVDAGQFGSFGGNASAWDAFEIIRLVLLVVAIASIVAGAASLGLGPVTAAELPSWLPMAVAVGGAVAVLLVLFRMFVTGAGLPDTSGTGVDVNIGRAFGAWLLLDAGLVIVLSNLGLLRSLANKQRQTA